MNFLDSHYWSYTSMSLSVSHRLAHQGNWSLCLEMQARVERRTQRKRTIVQAAQNSASLQVPKRIIVIVMLPTQNLARKLLLPLQSSLHTDKLLPVCVEGVTHCLQNNTQLSDYPSSKQ